MPNLNTKQQQILDSIVTDFNHNQTLTVQDAAKFPSFTDYEISATFILTVTDNTKFYQLLTQNLDDGLTVLFADDRDPKTIIQELIQELGGDGQLNHHLDEFGLTIVSFEVNE